MNGVKTVISGASFNWAIAYDARSEPYPFCLQKCDILTAWSQSRNLRALDWFNLWVNQFGNKEK